MSRRYTVTVDGTEHQVTLLHRGPDLVRFEVGGTEHEVSIAPRITMRAETASDISSTPAPARAARPSGSEPGVVRAPMPGLVVAIKVALGERVSRTTTVAVIEAMKMENNLSAGVDGVVKSIEVKAGQEVENRAVLVTIEPGGA
jgi:biotin carboxyl carrier protein